MRDGEAGAIDGNAVAKLHICQHAGSCYAQLPAAICLPKALHTSDFFDNTGKHQNDFVLQMTGVIVLRMTGC